MREAPSSCIAIVATLRSSFLPHPYAKRRLEGGAPEILTREFACSTRQVDAYVLNWLQSQMLTRQWFVEERDGNCRLRNTLATRLAQTLPAWRRRCC